MSTYLVAIVVGDLEYLEETAVLANNKHVIVRAYTFSWEKQNAKYAVQVAARVVEYFSEYFNYPYPLPKLDLVAIPDFPIGAMENFGCMTFRMDRLLFSPTLSSGARQRTIAYIVAHEIAHQWLAS
jgi:aminopeptidase 2